MPHLSRAAKPGGIHTTTAEQENGQLLLGVDPRTIPVYTWNLGGYRFGHGASGTGNRHTFGGLSDKAFRLIPLLEAGRDARWDDLFSQAA